MNPLCSVFTALAMTSANFHSSLRVAERAGLQAVADGSNFVFSPLSLHVALALAAAGAKGETLDQMLSFLGSPTLDHLNSASATLIAPLRASHGGSDGDAGPRLSFASGVWIDRSLVLRALFQDVAANVYGAVAKSVDFQYQASEVAKEVNDWVHKETNGVISDLLPDGAMDESTRLILANALYFKGAWAEKFDSARTKEGTFHLLDKSTVQVPFMSSTKKQFVSSFHGFKVLKLDYQEKQDFGSFYMLFFLPDQHEGLSELMRAISSDSSFIKNHTPYGRTEVGSFKIPKFKITYKFEASQVMKDLGVIAPFTSGQADFTKMVTNQHMSGKLFISSIHHKANIEVDEEGTVAAAATAIGISLKCYTPPVDFIANHPFVFAILEGSGSLLFLGHVVNPLLD